MQMLFFKFDEIFGDVELPVVNIDDEESDDELVDEDWVAITNDPSFLEMKCIRDGITIC